MAASSNFRSFTAMHSFLYFCTFLVSLFDGYLTMLAQEYCTGDMFTASCSNDEVIVMQTAEYGRMRVGQCITQDMGHIGCFTDALKHFDNTCSNRKSCEVQVFDSDIPVHNTCPVELRRYLEANYTCEKVLQIDCSANIVLQTDKRISSADLKRCGISAHLLIAKPGQQLNISVQDFNWDDSSNGNCRINYGTVKDMISANSKYVCGGNAKERHLMVSNGNTVEVAISHTPEINFLLHITLLGCGDIETPIGAWIQREGDDLIMGCHSGKHTWKLTCVGDQWQGVTGQCGTDIAMAVAHTQKDSTNFWGLSLGILVFAACSILLLLSAVIFTIGVCVHVNRSNQAGTTSKYALYNEQQQCLTMHPCNLDAQRFQQGTLPMQSNRC